MAILDSPGIMAGCGAINQMFNLNFIVMRKMKKVVNGIRLLVLVIVLLAWYSSGKAQCYQHEEIKGDEAASIYEYFCTGYWLFGTLQATNVTMYLDSREDQFFVCGLSDETHDLCNYLLEVEISEEKDKLIVSGETSTYSPVSKITFKTVGDYVHAIVYDKNDKVIYESQNFEWYSY